MAVPKPEKVASATKKAVPAAGEAVKSGTFSLKEYVKKFYNDWSFHLAQALAFGLITAIVPIAILLLAILGFFLNSLNHQAYTQVISHISQSIPQQFAAREALDSAARKLSATSGPLLLVAILAALFFGSRLFTLMEASFDLVYHRPQRPQSKKNLMAVGMVFLFIILLPILVFASILPDQVVALLQNTAINTNSQLMYRIGGIAGSLIVSFILFEAFYVFVPNWGLPFSYRARSSWLGAFIGAILVQVLLLLFPLYIRYFMSGYVGQLSFALIVLVAFYLLAVIILIGAQINAYYVERISPPSADLITRASRTT